MKRNAAILILLIVVCSYSTKAQDTERASLKGHKSIDVVVEDITRVEGRGLTTEQVKADVELLIRKSGIRIEKDASNYLRVSVTILPTESGTLHLGYAYGIDVTFNQPVTVLRNDTVMFAGTWSRGATGVVGRNGLNDIRSAVTDKITVFVNEFLAANQK